MNEKGKDWQDYLHEFPENVQAFFGGIDKPSFGGGAVVGTAVGAVATVVLRNLGEKGTFDPINDFVDYVRAYRGNAEVISVDADIVDVIEVDSEVVEVITINEDEIEGVV